MNIVEQQIVSHSPFSLGVVLGLMTIKAKRRGKTSNQKLRLNLRQTSTPKKDEAKFLI